MGEQTGDERGDRAGVAQACRRLVRALPLRHPTRPEVRRTSKGVLVEQHEIAGATGSTALDTIIAPLAFTETDLSASHTATLSAPTFGGTGASAMPSELSHRTTVSRGRSGAGASNT